MSKPASPDQDSGIATSGDNEIKESISPVKTRNQFKYSASSTSTTITLHYYPEGGWGWIIIIVSVMVNCLTHGFQLSSGIFMNETKRKFSLNSIVDTGWLASISIGVSLFISPITVAFCNRKSIRLTAVIGGLVIALGCLFTSFGTKVHQLFFSYGIVVGIGVSLIRDSSMLMIAQYFKKRREFVEVMISASSGLGIATMSVFMKRSIDSFGYRLGLHLFSAVLFFTFFLGMFYRSASLYHPQRRAILHLKYQKRKIKEKHKSKDRPPFFDFKVLKSKSFRIILISNSISSFGLYNPIFYLVNKMETELIDESKIIIIQIYLGIAWMIGTFVFSIVILRKDHECNIGRQYLCQIALFICGICIITLVQIKSNFTGYVILVWIYGIFCGGYLYSLKLLILQNVRAKNLTKAWSFLQFLQSIPISIGVPITGYMNFNNVGIGYYFSFVCVIMGCLTFYFLKCRNNKRSPRKVNCYCVASTCNCHKNLQINSSYFDSFLDGTIKISDKPPETSLNPLIIEKAIVIDKPELTCISEEGIADMDDYPISPS